MTQAAHAQHRYDAEYAYPAVERARIALAVSLLGTGKNVLDVGAYDGQISNAIRQKGNRVTALDVSSEALKIAAGRGIPTICADLSADWPIDDNAFDAVFAAEVIEHIVDGDHFLRECRRVVVPGGQLVITTPNLASLGRRVLLLFGKNPYIDTALRPDQAGHVRYFVRESLRSLLKENGFLPETVRGEAVAFTARGMHSMLLAKVFPGLAKSLIVSAISTKKA
jgi:2-polyprenyl-3-methyl-5-hydroxy-6-metoxy-1,4-benzoquinol methylase